MSMVQVSYHQIKIEFDSAREPRFAYWTWIDGIGQAVTGKGATPAAALGNLFENFVKVFHEKE